MALTPSPIFTFTLKKGDDVIATGSWNPGFSPMFSSLTSSLEPLVIATLFNANPRDKGGTSRFMGYQMTFTRELN